jgi:hypothetical protein
MVPTSAHNERKACDMTNGARWAVAAETIAAEMARDRAADKRELAYTRGVWLASRRAWRRRGSDRNIAEYFAAEARYLATRAAVERAEEARATGAVHLGGDYRLTRGRTVL